MAFTHLEQVEAFNASFGTNGLHSMRPSTVESTIITDFSLGLTSKKQIRRIGLQTVDLLVRVGRDGFNPDGESWLMDIEADPEQIGKRSVMARVRAVIDAARNRVADGVRLQSGGNPYLLIPKVEAAEPLMEYPVLRLPMAGQKLSWMGDVLLMPEVNQGQNYLDMPSIRHASAGMSN